VVHENVKTNLDSDQQQQPNFNTAPPKITYVLVGCIPKIAYNFIFSNEEY
jgi:hypothetical protein